ncbi:MAG: response regulator [Gammaproteobacteria bacterium]|nr:response regulator [Gammaproteobacteria bacterium]
MKLRITLLIPLILALSTLVTSYLMYKQAINLADLRIHKEGINNIQLDISRLQNILYNRLTEANLEEARLNISVSAMNPAITNLILVDEHDKVLISNRYIWEGNPAHQVTKYQLHTARTVRDNNRAHVSYEQNQQSLLYGYYPITLQLEDRQKQPNKRIGVLYVEYSIKSQLMIAEHAATQQAITFAVIMLFVTALVSLLLHLLVSTRLNKLTLAAQSLAEGNLTTDAQLGGNDELSQLGNSINEMTRRLREDIQYREEAEQQIRVANSNLELRIQERTEQLQEAQHIAHMGNWVLDLQTGESFWSDEVYQLLGCKAEDFRASKEAYFSFIHPDDKHLLDEATNKITESVPSQSLEYRIIRSDERIIWMYGKIVGGFDESGRLIKLSGIIRDITQDKSEEAEREQLHMQLRQSHKMETLGQLTGGIAHDFNNMLTSISGFTQLAQLLNIKDKKSKLPLYLEQINKVSERAKNLVAQMLSFSRVDKDIDEVEIIELNAFIADSISMLRPIIPSSIDIIFSPNDERYSVSANSVMLSQVIMNLFLNAKDAITEPHGSINISVSKKLYQQDICTSCHHGISGEYIDICIKDTGEGIPTDILNRLFDPFFTTKGVGQGSGMGLSIVHGIIHRHNGHLLVDSSSNTGTSFDILLKPEDDNYQLDNQKEHMTTISSGTGQHILVVDDDPAITTFLTHMLEAHDYRVTAMSGSIEALDFFQQHHSQLSLVITDQTMPMLTGIEMARKMLHIADGFPIILCTGYSEQVDEKQALEMNIKAFLSKPYQNSELLKAIQMHIRR